ncbi:MAG: FAD-dependent thymidylate synthase [Candidatus Peribacteria bacterium]|jgi:thymidylate synthase ThyX|nr:FAD-dependent thymidylate synthase [Candidatus Peribacteria bacterium]
MLQALHSRSIGGIANHLQVLAEKGAENFMEKFYVGYGHKSIGDCGDMTVFIEGVSLLVAKAIQDTKLYSGQESSTRYVDFSKQLFINPSHSATGEALLEQERAFYLSLLPALQQHLSSVFPIEEGQSESVYTKAIAAKAFDIARGFLPAGASTNLAWHTNLRQLSDRLLYLRHHPLAEVREVAEALEEAVIEKYPHSFSNKRYEDTELYMDTVMQDYYFHQEVPEFQVVSDTLDKQLLKNDIYIKFLSERPNGKTELPVWMNNLGTMTFQFLLDFGSFRDVQRHRATFQRMPLLTDQLGFHPWYLEQLPAAVQEQAIQHLEEVKKQVQSLSLSPVDQQYYLPIGYRVANEIMGTLPALVYLCEIRTSQHVHPTLRKVAQKISQYLMDTHQIKLFVDMSEYAFDIKRGQQDIVMK